MGREVKHSYEFGPFRLDTAERQLLRDGEPVPLTPKAFETLVVLVERGGHLVEKEELLKSVWAEAYVEEANLARCVHTLRKALGEERNQHRYIETVPKRGYRFVAEVRETETGGGAAARQDVQPELPDKEVDAKGLATPPRLRVAPPPAAARVFVVSLALVVSAVAVGAYLYVTRSRLAAADEAPITSIAVLPFVNVNADPEVEHLSDGLSESVIDRLSQLPQLKVIARSSSFMYRGGSVDVQDVANELGVQAVVTGRVVRRGENLSIRAELVDARANKQIWGEQFERKATDALAVQQEIARTVTQKLRLKMSGAQERRLAKREAVDLQAYELLLRGRFYWNKGGTEDRKKAVEYFNQAVAVDPNYALAHAELAYGYSILGHDGNLNPKEAVHKAEEEAAKALELDEDIAEAHIAMAYNKQLAWEWVGAEREYRRSIELNPNYAEAHAPYSVFLSVTGRYEEAATEAERAKELDPFSIRTNIWVFNTSFFGRRYDEALDILKQMQELDPNHPLTQIYFGYTYAAVGRYPEAIAAYKEAMKLGGTNTSTRIYLGYAYAGAGQREEAQAILSELQKTKQYVSPAELAVLYAGLGEKDQALLSLERAYEAHDVQLQYLNADPHFDTLRSHPRFQALLQRIGLPK